jgi:hypothetical protein
MASKGSATLISGLLDRESPQYKRKMAAAKLLMDQPTYPNQSPWVTLAQQLSKVAGGIMTGLEMNRDDAQRSEVSQNARRRHGAVEPAQHGLRAEHLGRASAGGRPAV